MQMQNVPLTEAPADPPEPEGKTLDAIEGLERKMDALVTRQSQPPPIVNIRTPEVRVAPPSVNLQMPQPPKPKRVVKSVTERDERGLIQTWTEEEEF
jgi:hypothetical protein